jgi:hypothetical protein
LEMSEHVIHPSASRRVCGHCRRRAGVGCHRVLFLEGQGCSTRPTRKRPPRLRPRHRDHP